MFLLINKASSPEPALAALEKQGYFKIWKHYMLTRIL